MQGAFINRRLYVTSGQGVEKDANCTLQPATGRAMCNYNQMLDIAGR